MIRLFPLLIVVAVGCGTSRASESTVATVGEAAPDFTLTTYEPKTKDFGEFSLAAAKEAGQWTVLFFYPADFTFV